MDRALRIACLRGRTSDRTPGAGAGAQALALTMGGRVIGEPGEPAVRDWSEDLRGERPVLTASDCSICIATFPTVAAREPDAHFAWIDAHGDFNTPDTTPSSFLGGMCLAAACGRWDAGWPGPVVDPARVHLLGVRELDPGEEREVEAAGLIADVPEGVPLYVHLDTDVLDPSVMASQFPVPGGWDERRLRAQLVELAAGCRILGVEVTALEDPAVAPMVAGAIRPLLAA